MTTKDDAVDPGQAGAPDLDVWRVEAGAALAIADGATPGPWETDGGDVVETVNPIDDVDEDCSDVCEVLHYRASDDADEHGTAAFIAAARTGWPRDAARVAVLVDMLDRARAVLDALPHCLGTWVKGSGGHCVYANDCRKIATVYEDGADGYNFCDEHGARNILDKFREEYLWADAVRALDAAGAKEPSR